MRVSHCLMVASLALFFGACGKKSNMLHPDFPIVEGRFQLTDNWSVTLEQKYNRRSEDGSLVLWRPGVTIWTVVWKLKDQESVADRYRSLKDDISPQAVDLVEETDGALLRLAYRLNEESDDAREPAFYCFAVGPSGHVQMAIYFDGQIDVKTARAVWRSLTPVTAKREPDGAGGSEPISSETNRTSPAADSRR